MWYPCFCSGQVLILSGSQEDQIILKHYQYQKNHSDSLSRQLTLQQFLAALQQDGYFTARTSSLRQTKDTLYATVHPGHRYEWAYLQAGNLNAEIQERSGFREKLFLEKPFRYDQIRHLFEKILQQAENTGYPFATVQLKEVQVAGNHVSAAITYQPGPYITFGRVQVKGTRQIKPEFLQAYLGIQPKSSYDERKIKRIGNLIRALPYLDMTAPVAVTFQNETADVVLTVSERKSNQVDGVVNFLPPEAKGDPWLLTGEFHIALNNLAKSGKQFALDWQRLQIQSQQLKLSYEHPNVFHSFLHLGARFSLYKEDTLFVNRRFAVETGFPFGATHQVRLITDWQSSRLTADRPGSDRPAGNFDLFSLGLGYTRQQLDHAAFPRQGYALTLLGRAGRKKIGSDIIQSDLLPSDLPARSVQSSVYGEFTHYHKLSKAGVLFHKVSGGWLINEYLLLNDLYRLGGLHSLRGFYDNFFFASQYALSNLEVRWLLEESPGYSYLFVFYDQAYLLRTTYTQSNRERPAGLGIGLNLGTSAGLFRLAYAVGKTAQQPFNFNLAKIHFGYISRF